MTDGGGTGNLYNHLGAIRDPFIKYIGGNAGSDKQPAEYSFLSTSGDNAIYPFPSELSTFINSVSESWWKTEQDPYNKYLKNIPRIEVRAYAPDTILTFADNIIDTIISAYNFAINSNPAEIFEAVAKHLDTTADELCAFFGGLFTKTGQDIFYSRFSKVLAENKNRLTFLETSISKNDTGVIDIPYNLYFNILGSTTNAKYIIPVEFPANIYNSDGSYGWSNNDLKAPLHTLSRTFSKSKNSSAKNTSNNSSEKNASGNVLTTVASTLGSFAFNKIAEKLNFKTMPMFDPSNDKGKDNETITVNFDLVNDTIEKAAQNYSFIQTLIANNKWVQTFVFSNPSNLYDVKIPGGYRLFACTADINVSYKGAVKKIKTVEKKYKKRFAIFGDETRIPEAYSVKIIFKSLIPGNFNTYIMGMVGAIKCNLDNELANSRDLNGAVGDISKGFGEAYKEVIKHTKLVDTTFDSDFYTDGIVSEVLTNTTNAGKAAKEEIDKLLIEAKEMSRKQLNNMSATEANKILENYSATEDLLKKNFDLLSQKSPILKDYNKTIISFNENSADF